MPLVLAILMDSLGRILHICTALFRSTQPWRLMSISFWA